MPKQSRQLAAIMFTDIVGYTSLMGEDEEGAFELLKKNRQIQRPIIEKYHGRWIKELGDGVLASFTSVSDAVYCAMAIQAVCLEEDDLTLRIGIHQGEVVFEEEDVFGDGVNIASRLEPLAPVGGILVSESVNQNLGNKKGIATRFLREENLKNVKNPLRIYEVIVAQNDDSEIHPAPPAGSNTTHKDRFRPARQKKLVLATLGIILIPLVAYLSYKFLDKEESLIQPAVTEIIDKSIAVLPFKDDSEGSDNQYFCDGMMDEILNHLQKIAELGVKSRTDVEVYRNTTQSIASIADELNVAFVLEGAVRKYGDRFRVTTQLIDVGSGNHLWSDTYDGTYSDSIFIIQSQISKKIATSLNAVITPTEETRIDQVKTNEITAYDFLIRSRYETSLFYKTWDVKHLKNSHNLIDKALEIDPNYVDALSTKATTYSAVGNLDSAIIYSDRALKIDPNNPSANKRKGRYYQSRGKSDLAIKYYQKSLKYKPNQVGTILYAGQVYCLQKKDVRAGYPYIKKAMELIGDGENALFDMGVALLSLGEYEKADIYFRRNLAATSSCRGVYGYNTSLLAEGNINKALHFTDSICPLIDCDDVCDSWFFNLYASLGEIDKAAQYMEGELADGNYNPVIGYVYHNLGSFGKAEEFFQACIKNNEFLSAKHKDWAYPDYGLAQIHAFQNRKRKALKSIEVIIQKGQNNELLDMMIYDPMFENLRDDPEFKAIIKKVQEEKMAIRAQIREIEMAGEDVL